jgi:hypothetical protein
MQVAAFLRNCGLAFFDESFQVFLFLLRISQLGSRYEVLCLDNSPAATK